MVKNNSHNANYMNEGLFTFLFDCDAKRKVNRKEKHANHCAAYGIALRTGYKYKVFIRFCPYGQKSIRRLKNGAFDNNLTSARRCP